MRFIKRSSSYWLRKHQENAITPYVKEIIDHDGWDRDNFEESWNERITKKEFDRRLSKSTCNIILF
jgi:hypothetical protein